LGKVARQILRHFGAVSQEAAGELLNVGRRSVQRAREVLDEGAPELVTAVERGDASVSAAANVAMLPKAARGRSARPLNIGKSTGTWAAMGTSLVHSR
jgi:hypothetical protein